MRDELIIVNELINSDNIEESILLSVELYNQGEIKCEKNTN
jgi:hypothetical protein